MNQSSFFSINWKDFGKAVIVAFLTAFVQSLIVVIDGGALPTVSQIKAAAISGAIAAAAYLLKNLLTNSDGQPLKKDQVNKSIYRAKM